MKKLGKQAACILAAALAIVLFIVPIASGEQGAWDCPECGRTGNLWNYCGNCAHPAPWTTAAPAAEAVSSAPSAPGSVIVELGEINSLNVGDRVKGTAYHFTYPSEAAENPSTGSGHGFLYVNSDSDRYGLQIVYSNTGIYTRRLNSETYGEWTDASAPAVAAAAPSGSSVIELGAIASIDISDRTRGAIYHFTYESGEGSPTSGSGHGYLYINTDSSNYGRQIFISNRGIYSRNLNNGTYGSWKTLVN